MGHWGGTNLGILSKPPRPIRGGSTASLHNWGMAWDWRWANPGPGRANADAVIEFCINHAAATGIQAVHDYATGRYWHSNKGWRERQAEPVDRVRPVVGAVAAHRAHVGRGQPGGADRRDPTPATARPQERSEDTDQPPPAEHVAAGRQRRRRCRPPAGLPALLQVRRLHPQRRPVRPAHEGGGRDRPDQLRRQEVVPRQDRRRVGPEVERRRRSVPAGRRQVAQPTSREVVTDPSGHNLTKERRGAAATARSSRQASSSRTTAALRVVARRRRRRCRGSRPRRPAGRASRWARRVTSGRRG